MSDGFDTLHWPVEVRLHKAEKVLEVDFDDGRTFRYTAEFLRVHSPSAEVVGHGPGQRQIVPGRAHVGIMELQPEGNYGVRIIFDDLHETGIYSWRYLREIGEQHDALWQTYLEDLEQRGLQRQP